MNPNDLTGEQMREVPCIRCDAKVAEPCKKNGLPLIGCHSERAILRAKMPCFPVELNATDKALVCYYAFIMLCDSVSTKSVETLGKQLSSAEVQRFFAKQAIDELKKDGLIK
jgi:hypothetical protein